MNMLKVNCGILTVLHMLVDALCCCCLFLMTPGMDAVGRIALFVVYNCVAFLTQPITGYLMDRIGNPRASLAVSVLMLLVGAMCCMHLPSVLVYVVAVLIGLGNSVFHVYGGKYVAVSTSNDMRFLGVFVSTGALGLFLGGKYASIYTLYILMGALFLITSFYIYCAKGVEQELLVYVADTVKNKEFRLSRDGGVILSVVLFIVFFRSFLGKMVPASANNMYLFPLLICMMAVVGKALGGYIARRFGIGNVLYITLFLSLAFFLFGQYNYVFLVAMILFINLSMPATLSLANRCLPGYEGVAFGLVAAFLIPGYALGIVCVDSYYAYHLLCPLFATIVIEELVLIALGERRWKVLSFAVVINILTNVPLNLLVQEMHIGQSYTTIVLLEFAVVIIETILYCFVTRSWHMSMKYSVLCNAISYFIGLAFQSIVLRYLL